MEAAGPVALGSPPRGVSSAGRAYSDRFIPSRAVSARLDFSVLDREAAASEAPRRTAEKEESNGAYNMLLRSELLGCPTGPLSPEKGAAGLLPSSPTKRWVV